MPLVSVLLPAFNAAGTVDACLRSVKRQTLASWECIVVDDGSGDDTLQRVRAVAAGDARFVVLSRPHRGLVATLNEGLGACSGAYVARMDADDVMHRRRLELQVDALDRDREPAAVGCHVRVFPRAGMQAGWRAYERWLREIDSPWTVRREAFVESPVVHPTLLARREVLQRFAYRDQGWPEDYDLLLRLLEAGHEVGMVPRRLLAWRNLPTRLTRTSPAYARARITACKAAYLARGFLAGGDLYALWGFGHTGRALHAALRLHGKRLALLVEMHPGRLGNTIHGAPVTPPEALRGRPPGPLIVSVAGSRPRRACRFFLNEVGLEEGRDFVCAA